MIQRTPIRRTPREKPRRERPELFFKPEPEAFYVLPDGREICNTNTYGRAEYGARVLKMWKRQKGLCCNCRGVLLKREATFEHENGRGGGKRDDRIEIAGKPVNGASHGICNVQRGSKRTPIWHGEPEVKDGEK